MASDWARSQIRQYRHQNRRRAIFAAGLIAVLFVICLLSLSISRIDISLMQAFDVVMNHITGNLPSREDDYAAWWIDQVVINDNAPRTIGGICVGIILSVCGAVMQSVTRNPLADPYTIGISSAALFGVTISIVFGFCVIPMVSGDTATIINAFAFSLIPAALIVFISSFKKTSSTMMILIGIATMYMFTAFSTFIKFNAESEDLEEIYEWSLGTLVNVEWSSLAIMVATSAALLMLMFALSNKVNILSSGDNEARTLGENPVRLRILCFLIISIATAVAVCYTGTIGFVGLVAPHIARLFVGSNNKVLIPSSAIAGALMVVGADCLVRMLPHVLPVGVITALIGSPLFLYFLYKQKKNSAW